MNIIELLIIWGGGMFAGNLVDKETCVDCGTCIEECPEKAISEGA